MPPVSPRRKFPEPSLGYLGIAWIEAHCAQPDGDDQGDPFVLTPEQEDFVLWLYALEEKTGAWVYSRGAQLLRPQKWGKGPLAAALTCFESYGPARFAGYENDRRAPEPKGKPWATPLVQITAVSEDQTANTWRALQPMIELGDLAAEIPDTGETRINLPNGGRIEPVTSSARSRLGQRVTFSVQDETHSWLEANGGHALADTQRRNLAGMGGRYLETSNAFDPIEESVAQRTYESKTTTTLIDDVEPGEGSITNKRERRRMIGKVYGNSLSRNGGWIGVERIEDEIDVLLEFDPPQAERFYLNRKLAMQSAAFDKAAWEALRTDFRPRARDWIVVGVDGARTVDALAVVATHVAEGFQWPLGIWETPATLSPEEREDYEHPLDEVDGALVEAMRRFRVWRVYIDPQYIEALVATWQGRYGDRRIVPWYTNRPTQIAWACRHFAQAITLGSIKNDGNPDHARHIGNARRRRSTVTDDDLRPMWSIAKDRPGSPRKIDAAMASILSRECRQDALEAGITTRRRGSGHNV